MSDEERDKVLGAFTVEQRAAVLDWLEDVDFEEFRVSWLWERWCEKHPAIEDPHV